MENLLKGNVLVWRKVATNGLMLLLAGAIAAGIAWYVYPVNPTLVWILLFLCWGCYRLHLRAKSLFEAQEERRKNAEKISEERRTHGTTGQTHSPTL
jgi:hypothetical protein